MSKRKITSKKENTTKTYSASYFYRNNKDGEERKKGPWSEEERQMFLLRHEAMMKDNKGQTLSGNYWGNFSKEIYGRVGYQCNSQYRKFIEEGVLHDPNFEVIDGKAIFIKKNIGRVGRASRIMGGEKGTTRSYVKTKKKRKKNNKNNNNNGKDINAGNGNKFSHTTDVNMDIGNSVNNGDSYSMKSCKKDINDFLNKEKEEEINEEIEEEIEEKIEHFGYREVSEEELSRWGKRRSSFSKILETELAMKITNEIDYTIIKDMCALCGSVGLDDTVNTSVRCKECAVLYHTFCLDSLLDISKMKKDQWDNWRCPSCRKCSSCSSVLAEKKLLVCDRCNEVWHTFCVKPPLAHVPDRWLCSKCGVCEFCGGKAYDWGTNYVVCAQCVQYQFAGSNCSFCSKNCESYDPVRLCRVCGYWTHTWCDPALLHHPTSNGDICDTLPSHFLSIDYVCSKCRKHTDVKEYERMEGLICEGEKEGTVNTTISVAAEDIIDIQGKVKKDMRSCVLCSQQGDRKESGMGRMVPMEGAGIWVHLNCIRWSPKVEEVSDGMLLGVEEAVQHHTKAHECVLCGLTGASIHCSFPKCTNIYHLPCIASEGTCTAVLRCKADGTLFDTNSSSNSKSISRSKSSNNNNNNDDNRKINDNSGESNNNKGSDGGVDDSTDGDGSDINEGKNYQHHNEATLEKNEPKDTQLPKEKEDKIPEDVVNVQRQIYCNDHRDHIPILPGVISQVIRLKPSSSSSTRSTIQGIPCKLNEYSRILLIHTNKQSNVVKYKTKVSVINYSEETERGAEKLVRNEDKQQLIKKQTKEKEKEKEKEGEGKGITMDLCTSLSTQKKKSTESIGAVWLLGKWGKGWIQNRINTSVADSKTSSIASDYEDNSNILRLNDASFIITSSSSPTTSRNNNSFFSLGGRVRMGGLVVERLGSIEAQAPGFHTQWAIYPMGYKVRRLFWSLSGSPAQCMYRCEIVIGPGGKEAGPLFTVTPEDDGLLPHDIRTNTLTGCSPEEVWNRLMHLLPSHHSKSALNSGSYYFGLTNTIVIREIARLPNHTQCTQYDTHAHRFVSQRHFFYEPVGNSTGSARTQPYKKKDPFLKYCYGEPAVRYRAGIQRALERQKESGIEGNYGSRIREECVNPLPSIATPMQFASLKKKQKRLECRRSAIQGYGVFTLEPVKRGDMIIEYVGESIRESVADVREQYFEKKGIGCYMFRLDGERIIDSTYRGNIARMMNHSCSPNADARVITVDKVKHIVFYAIKSIEANEEVTYDYKFPIEEDKIPCHCGSDKCFGFLN